MGVAQRFDAFLRNLSLTTNQKENGASMRESAVKALNIAYYNSSDKTAHSIFVGSWGKATRIRPPRDVDVLFELPTEVYNRFEKRSGNKQSQLLQEIRDKLKAEFPLTKIKGDGPVVLAPFTTGTVELVPAFKLSNGQYYIAMTDGNGRYKTADYKAEIEKVSTSNSATNNNTRDLVRMAKCWQAHCNVPLKSFHIEIVAMSFLDGWEHRGKSSTWYDWMMRDFFKYLVDRANTFVFAPGTGEIMYIGDAWKSRAESARDRAKKACEYEPNYPVTAGEEWQKIFGTDIPKVA